MLKKATGSKNKEKKGRKKRTQMSLFLLKPCSREMGKQRSLKPDFAAGLGKELVTVVAW